MRKHGRIITNNDGSGTFSRLALALGEEWRILRVTFETGSSQANHFGLRKPPMQPAVETPGRQLFWTRSDILFNMQVLPDVA